MFVWVWACASEQKEGGVQCSFVFTCVLALACACALSHPPPPSSCSHFLTCIVAQLLRELKHQNIIMIKDVFLRPSVDPKQIWILFEYATYDLWVCGPRKKATPQSPHTSSSVVALPHSLAPAAHLLLLLTVPDPNASDTGCQAVA